MKKLKISYFFGGSGNSEIIKILSRNKKIDLNLIINGYDDGKSTKYIRETFSNIHIAHLILEKTQLSFSMKITITLNPTYLF